MKLVIDRAKWLRGEGSKRSYLLRVADQKMCCLGFYGRQIGMTPVELMGYGTPIHTDNEDWPSWLVERREAPMRSTHSATCGALMGLNDAEALDDATREKQITEQFAAHGVEVEFIG